MLFNVISLKLRIRICPFFFVNFFCFKTAICFVIFDSQLILSPHNVDIFRIATTRIDILKGEDFRPMNRGKHMWNGEDQKMIETMQRKRPEVKQKATIGLVKGGFEVYLISVLI